MCQRPVPPARQRLAPAAFALLLAALPAAHAADGLTAPRGADVWPQWQARLTVSSLSLMPVSLAERDIPSTGLRLPAVDGALRATSGFLTTPRVSLSGTAGDTPADAAPYVGIGYVGLAAKGGWGLKADLGLVAESGGLRTGRASTGNAGLAWDGALRELRLTPLLQLGVSYAF